MAKSRRQAPSTWPRVTSKLRQQWLALVALLLALSSGARPAWAQEAMIIIDDLGYNLSAGLAIAELPMPLTLAIIPFSPHAQTIADAARANGKDVIVHSPMASLDGRTLDPGGLYQSMSQEQLQNAVAKQLASIPGAIGLNNHMGSLLTQSPESMGWLMQSLREHRVFFIDSRTSAESIAWETAQAHNVRTWRRDLFLDNDRTATAIGAQLTRLMQLSQRRGLAIAIGHPYPETIKALSDHRAVMEQAGVLWVTPSSVLKRKILAQGNANLPLQAE